MPILVRKLLSMAQKRMFFVETSAADSRDNKILIIQVKSRLGQIRFRKRSAKILNYLTLQPDLNFKINSSVALVSLPHYQDL